MGSAGASMGCLRKFVLAALLGAGLAGCASGGYDAAVYTASALPQERGHTESAAGNAPLQCVPYAREHSQIKIMGDASTWWTQASGRYERGPNPAVGTVMVLFNYAGPQHGHVAVVRSVTSAREIRVDHANWLDDGAIYVNDPVADVSAANDWSRVRVWNIKTGGWGMRIYPVQGFIGPGSGNSGGALNPPADPLDDLVAGLAAGKPTRVAAAPASVPVAGPVTPVSLTDDGRNPAPDSGFALTDQDREVP
jgi:surface antigen